MCDAVDWCVSIFSLETLVPNLFKTQWKQTGGCLGRCPWKSVYIITVAAAPWEGFYLLRLRVRAGWQVLGGVAWQSFLGNSWAATLQDGFDVHKPIGFCTRWNEKIQMKVLLSLSPQAWSQTLQHCALLLLACTQIPKGSVMGPVLFSLFTKLDEGTECSLSRFAGDTELGGVADTPTGCTDIQPGPQLERWAGKNLRKFPYPGKEQPHAPAQAGADLLKSRAVKDVGLASSVSQWPRKLVIFWAAWGKVWPAGGGSWSCSSPQPWGGPSWDCCAQFWAA